MTHEEIKNYWQAKGERLYQMSSGSAASLNCGVNLTAFLTDVGLPADAAPYLNFANGPELKILPLTAVYPFLEGRLKTYLSFGSDGAGNPIVINTANNHAVELLDHEDDFRALFVNSSLPQFAACLTAYHAFGETVIAEGGEDAFLDARFTDAQFSALETQLNLIDSIALSSNGFWRGELDNLQANREYYKATGS